MDYSTVPDRAVAWAHLAPLKVFRSANQASALHCIDLIAGADGEAKTCRLNLNSPKELVEYFQRAPMAGRTRFLYYKGFSQFSNVVG